MKIPPESDTATVSCKKCDKVLHGISYRSRCPDCKTPVVESTGLPRRKHDGKCKFCEYDIETLPADAPCPECGTPAALALAGTRLPLADTANILLIKVGTDRLVSAMVVAISFVMGSMLLAALFVGFFPPQSVLPYLIFGSLLSVGYLISILLWFSGWLRLTNGARDEHIAADRTRLVPMIRYAAIVCGASAVPALVGSLIYIPLFTIDPSHQVPTPIVHIALVLTITALVSTAFLTFAGLVLFQTIIDCTTNKAAKRLIRLLFWTIPLIGIGSIFPLGWPGTAIPWWNTFGCTSQLVGLWPIFFFSVVWLVRKEALRAYDLTRNPPQPTPSPPVH